MQICNFNSELMFSSVLFSNLFRNITIHRVHDHDRSKDAVIEIPVVIANRSRIFKNLENWLGGANLTLPIITVQRTGIEIVPDRVTNLHNEIKQMTRPGCVNYNLYTPVPIDITFEVTITAKYPNDLDLILGTIIPFFNQDVFVSHRHPKYWNVKFNSQVVMGNSINIEHPAVDLGNDADDIITETLTFTYKTYIFGGTDQVELKPSGAFIAPVTKIRTGFHAVPSGDPTEDQTSLKFPYTCDEYMKQLENGEIKFPEMDYLAWILGNDENGDGIIDPNQPYGYVVDYGDGITPVRIAPLDYARRAADMTNRDNIDVISEHNKQVLQYREPRTIPLDPKTVKEDYGVDSVETVDEGVNKQNQGLANISNDELEEDEGGL